MKKLLPLLGIVCMTVFIAGCGQQTPTPAPGGNGAQPAPQLGNGSSDPGDLTQPGDGPEIPTGVEGAQPDEAAPGEGSLPESEAPDRAAESPDTGNKPAPPKEPEDVPSESDTNGQ